MKAQHNRRPPANSRFTLSLLKKTVVFYFALTGVAAHLAFAGLYALKPGFVQAGLARAAQLLHLPDLSAPPDRQVYDLDDEIAANFQAWVSKPAQNPEPGIIRIGSQIFATLPAAGRALKDGDTLMLGEGIYAEPLVIAANDVTVVGNGHAVIEKTAAEGKAAIVVKGNNTTIKNIECRQITVNDGNGACIRQEGKHLYLDHVYFHDSQQGLLTGANPGIIRIENSRFEKLGWQGRAHGIYVGGGQLFLRQSQFIAAKSQGHEIKSRAENLIIDGCVIASLSSDDSRLLDIANGGQVLITNSILAQGPNSTNQDAIGYGLEGTNHGENKMVLTGNMILLERRGPNVLLHKAASLEEPLAEHNVVVAREMLVLDGANLAFSSRSEVGLADYPLLPKIPQSK